MFKKILFILIFTFTLINANGFLKRDGKYIKNDNTNNFIIKSMGLGGWLVPEGYMWQSSAYANSPTEIRNAVIELIGEADAEIFYDEYMKNHVARKDIAAMASWGFNAVRLPMHYELLEERNNPGSYIEEGFAQIDSLIQWCKEYNMYIILDLHCAAGGQSDEPISDWDSNYPSLWESEANKTRTVNLWKEIATRYKDEPWVGGYDLINEPKWELGENNIQLREMYIALTEAVREVDNNHILFIEGNWFATDFAGLTPAWDDNMCYSFHKYWNETNQGTINYLISLRNSTNVPLWLGETGENSNDWFTETVELMERNDIGWSWWPHKKVGSISGPLSVKITAAYQYILGYWNGENSKPGQAYAKEGLMSLAENLKFENCRFQPDVVDALFRAVESSEAVPYKKHNVPGTIYAVDYDMGKNLIAYRDNDVQNTSSSGGESTYNTGWAYRNDGVDIENCTDLFTNGFNVGWIENGEWMKYTFTAEQSGFYRIGYRYASESAAGRIFPSVSGSLAGSLVDLPATGGWQNWNTEYSDSFHVNAGTHQLMVQVMLGDFNLNYMEVELLSVTDVEDEIIEPEDFSLSSNYPNPFNPSTSFDVYLPNPEKVTLTIYDAIGNIVGVPVNNQLISGHKQIKVDFSTFNRAISSGIYFYNLKSKSFGKTGKIVYLK